MEPHILTPHLAYVIGPSPRRGDHHCQGAEPFMGVLQMLPQRRQIRRIDGRTLMLW
jgi:hypothetical protein